MSWVVDTAILIDVLEDDPTFAGRSASKLDTLAADGLTICPVSYVELAPAFEGSIALQNEFLDGVGVDRSQAWIDDDTRRAHAAWHTHVSARRTGRATKRPLADLLIGAFSCRFDGLVTRNAADFARLFPGLTLVTP